MTILVPCEFCGQNVDADDPRTWQRRSSWGRTAGKRASGAHGGSDIALRQWNEGWAHDHCIRLEQSGQNANQAALL